MPISIGGVGGLPGTTPQEAGPLPVPEPGWTPFTLRNGAKIVHVSSSQGSDNDQTNDGSQQRPYKTISHAKGKLTDGAGDWLLLKCGDTWNESLGSWALSGYSAQFPLLISSYGAGARPKIVAPGNSQGLIAFGHLTHNHLAIVDIEFTTSSWTENYPAIEWQGGDGLLVEGCKMSTFHNGLAITGGSNIVVRRNIITDVARNGLYVGYAEDLRLEENILYRLNNASFQFWWALAYIDWKCDNAEIIGNIFSTSEIGLMARGNQTTDGNLVTRCGRAYQIGGHDGNNEGVLGGATVEVTRNVAVGLQDYSYQHGVGIDLENIKQGLVSDNVLVNLESGSFPVGISGTIVWAPTATKRLENTSITDNLVYGWGGRGVYIQNQGGGYLKSLLLSGNDLHNDVDFEPCISVRDESEITQIGSSYNRVFSAEPPAPPNDTWTEFSVGVGRSLEDFKAAVVPPDSTSSAFTHSYPDPDHATLADYYNYVEGVTNGTHDLFMAKCLLQRKGNWQLAYTAEYVNNWIRSKFGK